MTRRQVIEEFKREGMIMAEYGEYISALRQCAKEHENDKFFTGEIRVTNLCNNTADLLEKLETDVVERSKLLLHEVNQVKDMRLVIVSLNEQNDKLLAKLQKIEQIVNAYDGTTPSMIKQFSEIQKVLDKE